MVDDGHLFLVSRARDVAPVVRRCLSGGDAPAATSPSAAKATTAVQTGSAARRRFPHPVEEKTVHRIDVHKLADEAKFNSFHLSVLVWCFVILISTAMTWRSPAPRFRRS